MGAGTTLLRTDVDGGAHEYQPDHRQVWPGRLLAIPGAVVTLVAAGAVLPAGSGDALGFGTVGVLLGLGLVVLGVRLLRARPRLLVEATGLTSWNLARRGTFFEAADVASFHLQRSRNVRSGRPFSVPRVETTDGDAYLLAGLAVSGDEGAGLASQRDLLRDVAARLGLRVVDPDRADR